MLLYRLFQRGDCSTRFSPVLAYLRSDLLQSMLTSWLFFRFAAGVEVLSRLGVGKCFSG